MRTQNRKGVTIVEIVVVLVILMIAAGALALPAVQNAREAARRSSCKCRLKQLGLGLHNYHETHNAFPSGWVAVPGPLSGEQERSAYGWATSILPFIDHASLFKSIDFNAADPTFQAESQRPPRQFAQTDIPAFRCPSDVGETQDRTSSVALMATANYVGNFGVGIPLLHHEKQIMQGVFGSNSRIRIRDLRDGTTNVALVGERLLPSSGSVWSEGRIEGSFNSYWAGIPQGASPLAIVGTATEGDITKVLKANDHPLNLAGNLNGFNRVPQKVRGFLINKTVDGLPLSSRSHFGKTVSAGFSSNHPGGVMVGLGDGSVSFIGDSVDHNTLINLMRRADGQTLGEF